MMEVWNVRPCSFCRGTGFCAKKEVYDRRTRILKDAQLKDVQLNIAEGRSPILFQIALSELKQKAKQYPPCSFCGGEKILKTREPDR